jgi:hypothetical protein
VANRLEYIHSGSTPEQWHHVEGNLNPADYASRGLYVHESNKASIWFSGPDFLKTNVTFSKFSDTVLDRDDVELKVKQICIANVETKENYLLDRYSSLNVLQRTTAWILRFVRNTRMKIQQSRTNEANSGLFLLNHLTPAEVKNAQLVLCKHVQKEHFREDINMLRKGKQLSKSNALSKLDPFIDDDGMLRVGGRLTRSNHLDFKGKYPIILPKNSMLSKLLVQNTHVQLGHAGKNCVVTKLREIFCIFGLKQLTKKLINKCVFCRKYSARIGEQKMSDLPHRRVNAPEHVFKHVGLDFFGPFDIKHGRSKVKRYGCIFTCLASRAVHLEVANNLDTDSCINCIRRLIARRGPIESILSDNGTNFIGANNEMKKEIQRLENSGIETEAARVQINWSFNTPLASHHGGVWESLIKQARKILSGLLNQSSRTLTDDELQTLFCEVESILNSRPLIPETSDDGDALTPNHLLIGRCSTGLPPGQFHENFKLVPS